MGQRLLPYTCLLGTMILVSWLQGFWRFIASPGIEQGDHDATAAQDDE